MESKPPARVLFAHGQESGPDGSKIRALSEVARGQDLEVVSPDFRDLREDPDARVDRLFERYGEDLADTVLVGSSMGGYVVAVAASRVPVAGLFLLAPALYTGGRYGVTEYQPKAPLVEVVHGLGDTVIPPENSIRFARDGNHALHLLPGGHRLQDPLPVIEELFESFLLRLDALSG